MVIIAAYIQIERVRRGVKVTAGKHVNVHRKAWGYSTLGHERHDQVKNNTQTPRKGEKGPSIGCFAISFFVITLTTMCSWGSRSRRIGRVRRTGFNTTEAPRLASRYFDITALLSFQDRVAQTDMTHMC